MTGYGHYKRGSLCHVIYHPAKTIPTRMAHGIGMLYDISYVYKPVGTQLLQFVFNLSYQLVNNIVFGSQPNLRARQSILYYSSLPCSRLTVYSAHLSNLPYLVADCDRLRRSIVYLCPESRYRIHPREPIE